MRRGLRGPARDSETLRVEKLPKLQTVAPKLGEARRTAIEAALLLEGPVTAGCWRIDGEPLTLDLLELDEEPAPTRPKQSAKPFGKSSAKQSSKPDPSDRVALVVAVIAPRYTDQADDGTGGRRALGSWLATRSLFGRWNDGEIRAVIEALPARARAGEITIGWKCLSERFGPADAARLEPAATGAAELRYEAMWTERAQRSHCARTRAHCVSASASIVCPGSYPGCLERMRIFMPPRLRRQSRRDRRRGCDRAEFPLRRVGQEHKLLRPS